MSPGMSSERITPNPLHRKLFIRRDNPILLQASVETELLETCEREKISDINVQQLLTVTVVIKSYLDASEATEHNLPRPFPVLLGLFPSEGDYTWVSIGSATALCQ